MKTRTIKYALIFLIGIQLFSCKKSDPVDLSDVPFLGGDNPAVIAAIDGWINQNLTVPYNMQVKYKFDEFEAADLNATIVPIMEDKVLPALKDIKTVWIDTYLSAGGETFMKTLIPKNITMIGSPSYDVNGNRLLGEAEGGLKILLYDMNRYDPANSYPLFVQQMHTIEHEFGHILHQHKYFSPVFQTICVGDYTGNWTLASLAEANSKGFVTRYSRSGVDDDFVETIATMLVEGKAYYEGLKTAQINAGNPDAADKFTKKEQIIVAYFKDKWNIDFYDLQEKVRLAMASVVPPPVIKFLDSFGAGKMFEEMIIDSTEAKTQFSGMIKDSLNKSLAIARANSLRFDDLIFSFTSDDTLLLTTELGPVNNPNSIYPADYRFAATKNSDGTISFGPVIVNPGRYGGYACNADYFQGLFRPVLSYLSQHAHRIDWKDGNPRLPITGDIYGKFQANDNSQSFFYGKLY